MDAASITAIKVIKTAMLHQFYRMVLLDFIILHHFSCVWKEYVVLIKNDI